MPRHSFAALSALILALLTSPAWAAHHLWAFSEFYSNADGSVQFIELRNLNADNEQFFTNQTVQSFNSDGSARDTFTFGGDLPSSDTSNRFMLIATGGFGSLPGGVTPDYTLPGGFLATDGGRVDFNSTIFSTVDTFSYDALPTDGQYALLPDGSSDINSPTNFSGDSGSLVPEPASLALLGLGGASLLLRRRARA